jgi:hypothetical protein
MNRPTAYPDEHSRLRAIFAQPFVTGDDIEADAVAYREADQHAADIILLAETFGMLGVLSHADDFVGVLAMSDFLVGMVAVGKAAKAVRG